jgi:hypothetical protein
MNKTLLCIALILILSACGPSPEQQAAMTATAMTASAAAWTPTPTATNTPTSTPTPTPTETPTPTLTPTPTDTPTITPSPTTTQDPDRYYSSDSSFSVVMPEGWDTQDMGMKNEALVMSSPTGGLMNILFQSDTSSLPLPDYADALIQFMKGMFPDLVASNQETRVTATGLDYIRMEIEYENNGIPVKQIVYFFENGNTTVIATFSRLQSGGGESDAVVDEVMDSFRFEP